MSRKLCTIEINGHPVTFFTPPHSEPDLVWVDALQLMRAFLPEKTARAILVDAQRFDGGKAVKTVRDGPRLSTVMCHAMAQGLTGSIDTQQGHKGDGPAFTAYCRAAAMVMNEHCDLDLNDIAAAYKNVGGPFFRAGRKGGAV